MLSVYSYDEVLYLHFKEYSADIMAGLSMTLSAEANCLHSEKHSVEILVGLLLTPMMRLAIYILNSVLIS